MSSNGRRGQIVWVPVQVPTSSIQDQLPTSYPFTPQQQQQQQPQTYMPVLRARGTAPVSSGAAAQTGLQPYHRRARADGDNNTTAFVNQDITVRPLGIKFGNEPGVQVPHILQIQRIGDAPVSKNGVITDTGCEPAFLGPETCDGAPPTTHYPYADA